MKKQETPEEFGERMMRQLEEAREEFARMTPEEQAEIMDAARSHAEKVRDQITASYEADIRAGRVNAENSENPPRQTDI
jgi:vacuolar-type H+-ATPase subunit E/Vma4